MARFCLSSGCPEVVEGRDAYCTGHDPKANQPAWQGRTPAHLRGYGWAWGAVRKKRLRMDGYRCQTPVPGGVCGRPAQQVDHVENVARAMEAGKREWTVEEVRSICDDHHKEKSERERVEGLRLAAQRRRVARRGR